MSIPEAQNSPPDDDPFAAPVAAGGGAPPDMEPDLEISESAARRVAELAGADGRPRLALRLTVSGGGCSGFQYSFDLDDAVGPDDRVFTRDGARVVTDRASLAMLAGSSVDFVDNLTGAYFQVRNPNAASSCGCGVSFSL